MQARQITTEKILLAAWAVRNFSPLLSRTKNTMGASHQKFARQKVGDTEKRAKYSVHSACSEMNVVRSFDRKFFLCSDFNGSW